MILFRFLYLPQITTLTRCYSACIYVMQIRRQFQLCKKINWWSQFSYGNGIAHLPGSFLLVYFFAIIFFASIFCTCHQCCAFVLVIVFMYQLLSYTNLSTLFICTCHISLFICTYRHIFSSICLNNSYN